MPPCCPRSIKSLLAPTEKTSATIAGQSVSITYASPRVKGREGKIFSKGGLISHDPHYPVWRAGANAATTLQTDTDLTIGNVSVPKGTYTLFVNIANPNQWTLIVNKQTGEWGLAYNGANDLGKVKMSMSKPSSMVEDLSWTIAKTSPASGKLILSWEDHTASVPFKAK